MCSLRLNDPEDPPDLGRITGRLARYPTLRFKLDPTPDWDDAIIAGLQATGAVDSVDFKGLYEGTVVDNPADPDFYTRIAEAFPDAWIEDPKLTPETDAALLPHRDRVTWDANIHSVEDVDGLPFPPKMVNVKPSRFGPLRRLFRMYDTCSERGIGMYGGGQFELGPGRGQIQYLASIFHPDGPNDVAPTGYNEPEPPGRSAGQPAPGGGARDRHAVGMSDAGVDQLGPAREGWPFAYVDRVRFGDLDAMRHLNNVEFLRFFETARIAYVTRLIPSHRPAEPEGDWGLIFAECHINYRAPAFFDEQIRTHVRPSQLRRSSVRMEFLMESVDDRRLLAEGWGALVGYDYVSGRPCALPDHVAAALREQGAEREA